MFQKGGNIDIRMVAFQILNPVLDEPAVIKGGVVRHIFQYFVI
jgi:hypothetical protein